MLKHNGDIYRIEKLSTLRTSNYFWYLFKDKLGTGSNIHFDVDSFENDGIVSIHLIKGENLRANLKTAYTYVGVDIVPEPDANLPCKDCLLGIEVEYSLDGNMELMLKQDGIRSGHEYRIQLEPFSEFNKMFFPLSSFKQPAWSKQNQPLLGHEISGMKLQLVADGPATSHISVRSIKLMTNMNEF